MEEHLIPDCVFPCDNNLEIPTLRIDVQPSFAEIPFVCFGEQKRTYDMRAQGTLHFYTDDYRFSAIYEHPEKILQHNPGSIVEPNWSCFNDTPIAFGLQSIYKKRWVARAIQEKGIGVFVDLNVAPKFYKLNLVGIPKGYNAYCTRGYTDRIPQLEFEFETAKYISGKEHPLFVVYGGGEIVKQWCHENCVIYVTPLITIKNKMKAIERIKKEGIAFVDGVKPLFPEMVTPLELPTLDDLKAKQVLNYSKYAKEIGNCNKAIL